MNNGHYYIFPKKNSYPYNSHKRGYLEGITLKNCNSLLARPKPE